VSLELGLVQEAVVALFAPKHPSLRRLVHRELVLDQADAGEETLGADVAHDGSLLGVLAHVHGEEDFGFRSEPANVARVPVVVVVHVTLVLVQVVGLVVALAAEDLVGCVGGRNF
jgi:hypothetical protein